MTPGVRMLDAILVRADQFIEARARMPIELPTKCVDNSVDKPAKYRAYTEKLDWIFGLHRN